MKSLQIEIFNGTEQASPFQEENRYAFKVIRQGVIDAVQTVSKLAVGKAEDYAASLGKDHIFLYETTKDYYIEEPIKNSLSGETLDMSLLMCKLPYPPSEKDLITKYFIVTSNEVKKQRSNHARHYGNEISIVSAYELGRDFENWKWKKDEIFNRGYVLGAHMVGHLMLSEDAKNAGHCKVSSCCMHPHMKGITDINKIIEARIKEERKGLFCRDSLKQFREYLESLKK